MPPTLNRTIFQNAWVVDDLEAACKIWTEKLGVGPFFIKEYEYQTFNRVTYYGAPSDLSMRIGISQAGPLQIELIQPLYEQNAYEILFQKVWAKLFITWVLGRITLRQN